MLALLEELVEREANVMFGTHVQRTALVTGLPAASSIYGLAPEVICSTIMTEGGASNVR